jgi:hypothetical protein
MQAFVDESERQGYLLAAVVVAPRDLDGTRTELRGLLAPRQRRLHFNSESNKRRRLLLARMCDLDVRASVYTCRTRGEDARRVLLSALATKLPRRTTRLVLEAREGRDVLDRRVLARLQQSGRIADHLVYEHLRPHEEPLLWVPDAVAWAVGAGGGWRQRAEPLLVRCEEVAP